MAENRLVEFEKLITDRTIAYSSNFHEPVEAL